MVVGDNLDGDATPLPTLEGAALRACTMLPQLVTQHIEATDPRRAELTMDVYRTRDDAVFFRFVFHNCRDISPDEVRRWDVVLCNWTCCNSPAKTVRFGPDGRAETSEAWEAAARYCQVVRDVFETMLKATPEPEDKAMQMFQVRDKVDGNRPLVTLIGF